MLYLKLVSFFHNLNFEIPIRPRSDRFIFHSTNFLSTNIFILPHPHFPVWLKNLLDTDIWILIVKCFQFSKQFLKFIKIFQILPFLLRIVKIWSILNYQNEKFQSVSRIFFTHLRNFPITFLFQYTKTLFFILDIVL